MTGRRLTSEQQAYRTVSENDWQQTVIDALRWRKWRVVHFRAAQMRSGAWATPVQADGRGFPDLFAVNPELRDVFVAELKREVEKPTVEQLQWLAWVEAAGIAAYVWRPSQIDEVHRVAERGTRA